jgi:hypothetical protein
MEKSIEGMICRLTNYKTKNRSVRRKEEYSDGTTFIYCGDNKYDKVPDNWVVIKESKFIYEKGQWVKC